MSMLPPQHPANEAFSQPITPIAFTPLKGPMQGEKRRLKKAQVIIGGIFAVFALAAWFVLTARSVFIDVTPVNSAIDLDGGFAVKVGLRYLVHSGQAELTIEAEGYYPYSGSLEINDQQNQSYQYELLPLPGFLTLTTAPAEGIEVIIDGESMGTSPLTHVELAAGDHRLALVSERWQPLESEFSMEGRSTEESLSFTLTPNWANVRVETSPAGAVVTVDGEEIGTTPLTAEVIAGRRSLRVKLPAHKAWEDDLTITALQDLDLPPITLEPADGLVTLTTVPANAGVTLNGDYQGQTPLEIEVTPNARHTLTFFLNGYETATRTLQAGADEEASLRVQLNPVTTDISVQVSPADAALYVNGEYKGTGNQTVALQALPQQLEFRAEGYVSETRQITPRPGLAQTLNISLLTLEEQRIASIKAEVTTPAGQKLKLLYPAAFTMGASRREAGRQANEILHDVVLNKPFYMGEAEVSNAQFRQFQPDHSSGVVGTFTLDNNNQPVVQITWNQAALYCNWLSEKEGLPLFYTVENGIVTGFTANSTGYRLPTEAEWEWAARTRAPDGDPLKFPWGDQLPPPTNQGNYADLSAAPILNRIINNYNDSFPGSAPVASFAANQHGLHDMGGNVSEWVHDFYGSSGLGGPEENTNPTGPRDGTYHVVRGSSWAHGSVTDLRLSFRDYSEEARDDVGFRIARYLEP